MAHVSICPLRSGSGTRLKILEAFSAGVPVVSTQLGAEGIAAKHGETIFIADTPQDFETAIITLIDNQEYATSISRRARHLASTKYEWSGIVETAIQDLLAAIAAKILFVLVMIESFKSVFFINKNRLSVSRKCLAAPTPSLIIQKNYS